VLVTNGCHGADLPYVPEHVGSNIGTVRVVAKILSKFFFAPVRSRATRLNRYLRNGESPFECLDYLARTMDSYASNFCSERGASDREEIGEFPQRQHHRRITSLRSPAGG
jgi:hypothetical protein